MAVKLVKFTNGEEIVADISIDKDVAKVKNPARFMISDQGIGMMPWVPLSDANSFEFDAKVILFQAEVDAEIKNAYNQRYGSGIVTATSMPSLKLTD